MIEPQKRVHDRWRWVVLSIVCALLLYGVYTMALQTSSVDISNGLKRPSWAHPFGTDRLGRDVLERTFRAAGLSMFSAISAAILAFCLGLAMSYVSVGFSKPGVDRAVVLLADGMRSFPALVLALLFVTSGIPLPLLLALLFWMPFWRTLRVQFKIELENPYAHVARMMGISRWGVIWGEVLPTVLPAMRGYFVVIFAEILSVQASLEFLGFGPPLTTPSLGAQLSEALRLPYAPWVWMPSLCVVFAVVVVSVYVNNHQREVQKSIDFGAAHD